MHDNEDENVDGNLLYALTWDHGGHRLYWSHRHGWVDDVDKAWLLCLEDIEAVDNEMDINKLPAGKEVRPDAEWRPVGRRAEILHE